MNDKPDRNHSGVTKPRQPGAAIRILAGAALTLLAWMPPPPAAAQDSVAASRADDWTFSVSPYLWAAGIEGTTATLPGLPPVDVDMSFGDVVDDLKPSGMVFFTANKGRLGFAADIQYVETEAESKALEPLFSRETLRSTSFVLSALANYLVFDDGRASLRLGGGARLWSVETDLELSSGLLPGRRVTSEETWVDPIVGANGVVSLGHKVFARGWAYVGGFGTVRAFPSSPPGATPKVATVRFVELLPDRRRNGQRPVCDKTGRSSTRSPAAATSVWRTDPWDG